MTDDATADDRGRTAVVVALADADLAASLIDAFSMRGFEVMSARGIGQVADTVSRDRAFVAIIDNADPAWLREVSDLLHARPHARVLALAEVRSVAELTSAVSVGVRGFVSPNTDDAAVARTVRAMLCGEVALPRKYVSALVAEVRRARGRSVETAAGVIHVTDREWEIIQLLLQRRSTREISEMLFVSVGTVRTHISTLGRKLGADDREHTIRLLERRLG